jgi:peptide deformylase
MKLIVEPNPILKQTAIDWDFSVDTNAEEVETEMIKVMKTFYGRGLAANQVGLLKRVFTIQLDNHPELKEPFAMFNPKVVSINNEQEELHEEGCLSFPNLWLQVKRPLSITSEYLDKTGKSCIIELTGIDARCFLHELDHLNGVVFTEKVSQMKLILARKKQRKK